MTSRPDHFGGGMAYGSTAVPWSAGGAVGAAPTQSTRIRTITLVLKGRGGLTLWAPPAVVDGVVQSQVLLGDLGRVVMLPNLSALASCIASREQVPLTRHPGWPELVGLGPEGLRPRPEDVYDLSGADALLAGGPEPTRIAALRSLVRVVAAIADYCSDVPLLELLSRRPGFGDLEDTTLNFFAQAGTTLGNQRWFDLVQTFSWSWEWVGERVGSHVTWSDDAVAAVPVDATTAPTEPDPSRGSELETSVEVAEPIAGGTAPRCPGGHPVIAGAAFCSTCGTPIGSEPLAPSTYVSYRPHEPTAPAEPPADYRSWIGGPAQPWEARIPPPNGDPGVSPTGPTGVALRADRSAGTPRPRVKVAVAAAGVVLLGLGALFVFRSLGPTTVNLAGTFALTDDATASAGCVGQGLDTDLGNGTSIRLTDPRGKEIGSTTLSNAVAANGVCTYTFDFLKTKSTFASYSVHVPTQPTMMMTQSELRSNGWHVSLHYGPPTTTVTGSLELTDSDTALEDCEGQGGYSDISQGATVIITDQDNKILGSGALDEGTAAGDVCTYTFSIDNVRQDETQYAVEITHRGKVVNSYAQMHTNNWVMDLTLGD